MQFTKKMDAKNRFLCLELMPKFYEKQANFRSKNRPPRF